MKSGAAVYYDGKVATRHAVRLSLEQDTLLIRGEQIERRYPLAGLVVPPAVGSVRRTVRLPDGGLCELDDHDLATALAQASGTNTAERLVHHWEKSLPLALAAVVVTTLIVALFIRFGIPAMARHLAQAIPAATEKVIARDTLDQLDRFMMHPSKLAPQRREELTALFRRVAGNHPDAVSYRLEFRTVPAAGANAFALPAGIVIITDDLVNLAHSDDEIAAVMAHELGHVQGRHLIRHLLQNSAAGLIIATLTGDLVSITSLAASLPTVLVHASFSRQFEREADDAAIGWMKSTGVPVQRYAEILARLQAQQQDESGHPVSNYLSTHPDTGERIRHILATGGD